MLERTRLEVQDIANKSARQVFARQNVRILAAEHVRQMVKREVAARFDAHVRFAAATAAAPVIRVQFPQRPPVELTADAHQVLPDVLLALRAECHVFLLGPTGTGKSTLAKQAAEAMSLPFHAIALGPATPMSTVFGHDTPLRRAFEHGGIMLIDELGNGHPGLLGELNQALTLGTDAHPDFHLIATGTTYGSRQALDRFVVIDVPVDEHLEQRLALASAPGRAEEVLALVGEVRKLRKLARDKQLPVMFSPRASIDGAKLIAAGASIEQVMAWRVTRGLSPAHRAALQL